MAKNDHQDFFEKDAKSEKKSKSSLFLVILILLAVLAVGALVFLMSRSENTESVEQIQETEEKPQDNAETTPAPNNAIVAGENTENLKIGQTVDFEGLDFTLVSARLYSGDQENVPEEGNTYIVLDINVYNNSQSDYTTQAASFTFMADGWNLQEILKDNTNVSTQTLKPGEQESLEKIYEVPLDWNQIQLRIKPNAVIDQTCTYVINRDEIH